MSLPPSLKPGFLSGVRVLELADEQGEFCGKLLAGAGADVVKIEPPGGGPTRRIGPFYQDQEGPERSLHFWQYNFGKHGVTLDITAPEGRALLKDLVAASDVFLETHPPGYLDSLGLGYESLRAINPRLIVASITPFGQTGPRSRWGGSDLVHLALGGMMTLCGYDRAADGRYDTPPIAPQMWHAFHMAGGQTYISVLGALLFRERTGIGQHIDASVHRSVSYLTGSDIAHWVYNRNEMKRQTARMASHQWLPEDISETKDGRHLLTYQFQPQHYLGLIKMLEGHGAAEDLTGPEYRDPAAFKRPEVVRHIAEVTRRWVAQHPYDAELWREAQRYGLHWAPVRRPEDNLVDAHWRERQTFTDVFHKELGKTLTYTGAPWLSEECPWRTGPPAPRLGEHNDTVPGIKPAPLAAVRPLPRLEPGAPLPFPIEGVRIVDLAWVVAGAGGPALLASLGAEDIRIEWKGHLDNIRQGSPVIPLGKDRDRRLAEESVSPVAAGLNQGGGFAEMNRGKRGIGLNMRKPEGLAILKELIRVSDVVVENFTADTLEKWGLGYEEMRRINPTIIYVQQPGFGKKGRYGDFRSSAPVAEAFTGLTEQSGLPPPHQPAGWGMFYLDYSTACCCAMAILSALYHRARTGRGQYIDSSLAEYGISMTGTAILDYLANERPSQRTGNRSPHKPAAPHGAYPCKGTDRWTAIACFDDGQWRALCQVLGGPPWAGDPRFATLRSRVERQDDLDALVESCTRGWDAFDLMERLQAAGVPAGVCQTAEDRLRRDPQLRHDGSMVPLANAEVGTWPARQFPVKLSVSPARSGGVLQRAFPCYAEDNDYVYGTLLGISESDRRRLREQGVI